MKRFEVECLRLEQVLLIYVKRIEIVDKIFQSQVLIVLGEIGFGKSI